MAAEMRSMMPAHGIRLDGRSRLAVTGVTDIDRFDDETVALETNEGELVICGSGLHIGRIDIEAGELVLDGTVNSLEYTDDRPGGSLFSRLFR